MCRNKVEIIVGVFGNVFDVFLSIVLLFHFHAISFMLDVIFIIIIIVYIVLFIDINMKPTQGKEL